VLFAGNWFIDATVCVLCILMQVIVQALAKIVVSYLSFPFIVTKF